MEELMKENYSDYELIMFEMLTYMNADKWAFESLVEGKYKAITECKDVGEYLDQFNINTLRTDDPKGIIGGDGISREEYTAIIDYLRHNDNIRSLVYNSSMENKHEESPELALDFKTPSGNHIVLFKGTTNSYEWKDNVEGIDTADTQSQIDAYEYIESIDSNNIIVVGHSKGGNKAMYSAIRSDKVSRCIAMDGQGFSEKFLEKYRYSIANNASKITNISFSADYVHGLMIQVPGSNQVYTGSYVKSGVNNTVECHSPNSIFSYYVDEDGTLVVTGDFDYCQEIPSISLIRGFTEYIIYSDSPNKEEMISYLAYIVGYAGANGKVFVDDLMNGKLKIDGEMLASLIAYFLKYCDENNVSDIEIALLLADVKVISIMDSNDLKKMSSIIKAVRDALKSNVVTKTAGGELLWIKILMEMITKRINEVMAKYNISVDNSGVKSILESLSVTLISIKKKYKDINYDNSKKSTIINNRLKDVSIIEDFTAGSSSELYYNLQGIQTALSKMEYAISCGKEDLVVGDSVVSGLLFDRFLKICDMYNTLHNKISELIASTQEQVKEVYDAVISLENS